MVATGVLPPFLNSWMVTPPSGVSSLVMPLPVRSLYFVPLIEMLSKSAKFLPLALLPLVALIE